MGIVLSSVGMAQSVSSGPAPNLPQKRGVMMSVRGPRGPMMRFRGGMARRFRGQRMAQWWKNPFIERRIGLTSQQEHQLGKIYFQSRLQMIDLRAGLEKQRLLLQPMLQAERPNQGQVLGQIDKIGQARTALVRARIEAMLATRNVLTPEQWQKLRQARQWRPRPMTMRFRTGPGSRPSTPLARPGR